LDRIHFLNALVFDDAKTHLYLKQLIGSIHRKLVVKKQIVGMCNEILIGRGRNDFTDSGIFIDSGIYD